MATANETWLASLQTSTPQEGFELAIKLAHTAVERVQPDEKVRRELRDSYARDANSLIATSQVVAIHFQTIAAANNYWRGERR